MAKMWKQVRCFSLDEWKQNIVYSYNRMLFRDKKKWASKSQKDMEELWIYIAKWTKPICVISIIWQSKPMGMVKWSVIQEGT